MKKDKIRVLNSDPERIGRLLAFFLTLYCDRHECKEAVELYYRVRGFLEKWPCADIKDLEKYREEKAILRALRKKPRGLAHEMNRSLRQINMGFSRLLWREEAYAVQCEDGLRRLCFIPRPKSSMPTRKADVRPWLHSSMMAHAIKRLAENGLLLKVRKCEHRGCAIWFYGREKKRFCSKKCQEYHYKSSPEWRAHRRKWYREYKKSRRALDEGKRRRDTS